MPSSSSSATSHPTQVHADAEEQAALHGGEASAVNIRLVLPAKLLNAMTFDGFLMYLGSPEGSVFNPGRRGIFQDLSQPLCHYFIASSHNTYLMEDQLRGHSSVEGYIR